MKTISFLAVDLLLAVFCFASSSASDEANVNIAKSNGCYFQVFDASIFIGGNMFRDLPADGNCRP